MDLSSSPKNPAFALHLAELLGMVSNPSTAGTIDSRLSVDSGETVHSVYTPANETFPAWYSANTGDFSTLFVSGCSVLGHATSTIAGYQGAPISPIRQPVSTYFETLAGYLYDTALSQGFLTRPHILLVGHSLGGALCEHIAKKFVDAGRIAFIRLCTYGAPKPGSESFASAVGGVIRGRWFCSDDPVPLLPPPPELLPSLVMATNVLSLARFANFVHPAGGIEITPAGELQSAWLPSAASVNATASLAGWLLAVDGSSSSGHHLAAYAARLGYWMQQHPGPNPPTPEGAPREQAGAVPADRYKQLQKNVAVNLALLTTQQNSTPVHIPDTAKFKYVRAGRFHIVTFNGATVSVSARERTARSFANAGNAWLHNLQRLAVAMPGELSAQLASYLQRAQTADAGFTPVLNVQLPDAPS